MSAWGQAWGQAWGNAWGLVGQTIALEPEAEGPWFADGVAGIWAPRPGDQMADHVLADLLAAGMPRRLVVDAQDAHADRKPADLLAAGDAFAGSATLATPAMSAEARELAALGTGFRAEAVAGETPETADQGSAWTTGGGGRRWRAQ